jgi:hypothetical protein
VAPSNACDADEDIGELEAPRSARSVRRYQPRGLAFRVLLGVVFVLFRGGGVKDTWLIAE